MQCFGISAVTIDSIGDAYLEFKSDGRLFSEYGEKLKIDSNVNNIYVTYTGQSGFSDILLLKNDGTINRIDTLEIQNTSQINSIKIPNVKDAVSVVSMVYDGDEFQFGASYGYIILDINGNTVYNSFIEH